MADKDKEPAEPRPQPPPSDPDKPRPDWRERVDKVADKGAGPAPKAPPEKKG